MKNNVGKPVLAVALGLVALGCFSGCTTTPTEEFAGKGPIAYGAMFRQAESVVMNTDEEAAPGCKQRKISHRVLISAPEVVVSAHGSYESVPFTGSGTPSTYSVPSGQRYSKFVERWIVTRCDTDVSYLVTYTPEGMGTAVTAELEK